MRPGVLLNIFGEWIDNLLRLWEFLTTPISYHLEGLFVANPIFLPVGAFLKLTGLYNFTWLEFMLGAGLAIYLGYQLCIWVLNLIT